MCAILFADDIGGYSMDQKYFFKDAKWVGRADATVEGFSVLRGHFDAKDAKKVTLNVLGLGFFKCYINGHCINPDTFLPLSSEYEGKSFPKDEIFMGKRIYVPQFDITEFVKSQGNVIDIHYGGGWYTFKYRTFGLPKAIYSIAVESDNGVRYYGSDEGCSIEKSFVEGYYLLQYEEHNYANTLDNVAERAVEMEAPDTEYCVTDCNADALVSTLPFKKVDKSDKGTVYDCGENTTGYPVIRINAKKGDTVTVTLAEECLSDGKLDPLYIHGQHFTVVSDGTQREVQPEFMWFGFRFFEIEGDAEVICVKVVHADVPVTSSFECDNETLNWTYKTFVHTMLCNMHTGHPSDCPHLERRGYTGDGQLTCHAVLSTLGARAFYEKWLQDIADSQDSVSGHVQYTAPYIRSGGGPGGWGCAIVEVPYQLYRHYGDKAVLEKYYHNMRRYIDYLESHSEYGLITSDKKGEWCLGDWCTPIILYPGKDIGRYAKQVFLPAPFVNNYFMVKSLEKMCEIAHIIGKDGDIPEYEEKIGYRKAVTKAAYYDPYNGSYFGNINGANAFAIDIGLQDNNKTYPYMIDYYTKLGCLDTGIFGTDILIRVLFETGNSDLAVELLSNDGAQGFEQWRKRGATTLHEYWDSDISRSHNHPMFGAPVAYFFEYLLGIKQKEGTVGYRSIIIEPQATSKFNHMSGSMAVTNGLVSVSYKKEDGKLSFSIIIPTDTEAVLRFGGKEYALRSGENEIIC